MERVALPTNRIKAPEFPREFAWVNTDQALSLRNDLKGNVVILDFWTYCCINCMHVLPDLEYLEHKYAGKPVVIIGIHSAKFDNEGDKRNIETACARYDIAHPVIVDENHRIWSEYAVRSWPTLMVIDPEGQIVGSLSGEGNREILDHVIYSLLEEGKEQGTLATAPPRINRTGRVPAASSLAFPGKVLAEPSGKFVFISDSNHDRIIIADTSGNVLSIAGSGRKGQRDGTFAEAEFDNPQGMAFDTNSNVLYVADTDNHLIRRLELNAHHAETISGTGRQVYDRVGGNVGRAQGLNSPWDLAFADDRLYIAMAGPHQLWTLDLKSLVAEAWVGSGTEDIQDGKGLNTALAQPSGLALHGDWLYFADSEVSAVRKVNVRTREVETLVGHGLFDFGDRDGALDQALFQHPLGVAVAGDDILVADTYNHKIKRISEASGNVSSLAGSGKSSSVPAGDGTLNLFEPGGLSVCGNVLYIADTNHDRIIEYDLSAKTWKEFTLRGLRIRQIEMMDTAGLALTELRVQPSGDLRVRVSVNFVGEIHLNRDAPISFALKASGDTAGSLEGQLPGGKLPAEITIPAASIRADHDYQLAVYLAYCTNGNESLCVPVTLAWRIRFIADSRAENTAAISQSVKPMT